MSCMVGRLMPIVIVRQPKSPFSNTFPPPASFDLTYLNRLILLLQLVLSLFMRPLLLLVFLLSLTLLVLTSRAS
jgi:hypothetical protein